MKAALLAFVALTLSSAIALACGGPLDTIHRDHRTTAKICIEPTWHGLLSGTAEGTARAFLASRHDHFGLSGDLAEIELSNERESLTARHVTFQQMLKGLPIEGAEVIVTIAKQDGRVMRTFNNIYPVGASAAFLATAGIDQQAAYDIAWDHLRAHGDLRSLPAARLVFSPEGSEFRLNWIVDLDLDGPSGGWRLRIDALSGAVVEVSDTAIARQKMRPADERIRDHEGPVADRQAAFARIQQLAAERAAHLNNPATSRASGTGVVFDPDPRTTLRNNALQNNSPSGAFTDAYFTRDLQDIEYDGNVYRLNGPWVHILDWDSPNTPPSTTTDGNWTATRGPNSFDDAMTYFQLDQNQRYMQSLGFVDATGIQFGSIGADTDGAGGADNSYYNPGSNRLSFGHGCVDDAEDVDVILHEYGHAINHSINSSWFGGDTGAMGEGFGDYWGGSYSYSTPEGPEFYPDWIFTWDGHGQGNQCWPGRIMNAHGAQYVHSTYYGAHQSIPGGYQSDELWSTPIFQSLRTLIEEEGQSRESVDSILLESQFGLGSGLKMRDMANVIIATAQELEPGGPHAAVLVEKFLVHNIILSPEPVIGVESFAIVDEPSGNGAADPGETATVRVTLSNAGLSTATAVSALLSTETAGITIQQGSAEFPDLPVGGTSTSEVDYSFAVDGDVDCGTLIHFTLQVSYLFNESPLAVDRANQLFVGVPSGGYGLETPYQPLPDNDGSEVLSTITLSGSDATVSGDFNMDISISHNHIADLVVRLTSPSGTGIFLHAFGGGSDDDIIGNYPNTLTPAQSFDAFLGEPLDGDWVLMVRDGGSGGTGILNSWALYDITGFECDSGPVATPENTLPTRFTLAQNVPNPFNPATEISFAVPAEAGLVTLDIFDLRGFKVRNLERSQLAPGVYMRVWNGRDDAGTAVSSGVYFYRLSGSNFTQTRKMLIVQ